MLKFNFKDICVLTENLLTGLVLLLKHAYLLVNYGVGCVFRLVFFFFSPVCLEHDQLCLLPGDIQGLHLAAWGWYHFHDAGSGLCGPMVFCMEPLNLMEEEGVAWAQMRKLTKSGKEAQPLQMGYRSSLAKACQEPLGTVFLAV